jgi:cyclin-C
MAANFWVSSHHKNWLRYSETISLTCKATNARDSAVFSLDEVKRTKVIFCRVISELAVKSGLRQRVAATAIVYFKRFYVRFCLTDHDPRLIAPVALYLAAKVEEHTLPAKVIIAHMASIYPTLDHTYPYTVSHIYDYEFKLIAALDFDLIIFHPYRPMVQYCTDAQLTDLLATAWPILNDSYLADVCLHYPPYLIAIACIYLAGTLADRDMRAWVATLTVSTQDLGDLVQTLASMYTSPHLLPSATDPRADDALVAKLQTHFGATIAAASAAAAGGKASGPPGNMPAGLSSVPQSKRPPSGTGAAASAPGRKQ